MPLIVETPNTRPCERNYILGVVLEEWLGLRWRRVATGRRDVRITREGHCGEVRLPDTLLSVPEPDWLTSCSMPTRELPSWDSREVADGIPIVTSVVPVLYGDPEPRARKTRDCVTLPLDVFGSAFFLLTRYEELVTPHRDEHDRFPGWASVAHREDFLGRPIVDEYVEILWSAMSAIWPQADRKERAFSVQVSHDVDHPSRYAYRDSGALLRAMAGDLMKRRDVVSAAWGPVIRRRTNVTLHPRDPYNTFDWLMDVSERHGLSSAFYFMCVSNGHRLDAAYRPEDPAIRALVREIHRRGHEIGLHPGYEAYLDPERIAREADQLRTACDELGVCQPRWGGRMHYLRWRTPVTWRGWEQAGMDYESTLTFADCPGFRCGTCREYPAYDLLLRRELGVRVRPLIAMEGSILSAKYMGTRRGQEATEVFERLARACRAVRGTFTLLWHNSELNTVRRKRLYLDVLDASV